MFCRMNGFILSLYPNTKYSALPTFSDVPTFLIQLANLAPMIFAPDEFHTFLRSSTRFAQLPNYF